MDIEITSWLSLLPSLVTLGLAFATRQVIVSLFLGVVAGGLVHAWIIQDLAPLNIIETYLLPATGSISYSALLLVYLWCLGGILGIWHKTGSAEYFAENLGKKIATCPRSALFFTWLLGIIFHQGGTVSTILTGTTIKPIADHYKISHEELSYVVDSTASPVATVIPFNAWPMYIGGLMLGTLPYIESTMDAYKFFLAAIPFNFYAIFAIILTLLFALNWAPKLSTTMTAAQNRARTTGALDGPNAKPFINNHEQPVKIPHGYKPSLLEFLVPICILLVVTITPFICWKTGMLPEQYANCTNEAFLLATLAAIIIAKLRGMYFVDIMDGFIRGCKEMTVGAIIFALALTLALVTKELKTAEFLIQMVSTNLTMWLLPLCLMLLCMIAAFATGSAFGTYAVVIPISMPLAYAIHPDILFMQLCLGAVLGGTVFGDQCSPISDTTIFSSMFTGCDLMDHVKTQLPYALFAAGCAVIISTGWAFYLGS